MRLFSRVIKAPNDARLWRRIYYVQNDGKLGKRVKLVCHDNNLAHQLECGTTCNNNNLPTAYLFSTLLSTSFPQFRPLHVIQHAP